jgi:hypothetical protein
MADEKARHNQLAENELARLNSDQFDIAHWRQSAPTRIIKSGASSI